MAGRPSNEDRQNAIALGLKTYTGTKHSKCGTRERYVAGGSCVHCARVIATEQREARKYLRQAALAEAEDKLLDGRGDQGGGYPSSQTGFDAEMQAALEADGEKLRQLTGEDHGPHFSDAEVAEALDRSDQDEIEEANAEARHQASIDELL